MTSSAMKESLMDTQQENKKLVSENNIYVNELTSRVEQNQLLLKKVEYLE
jgi:hypothetical protein